MKRNDRVVIVNSFINDKTIRSLLALQNRSTEISLRSLAEKKEKKNETQESVNCWKICRSGNERLTNRRIRLGCSWCRIPCNDNVHRKKGKIREMGSEELGKGILGIYRERSSVSCIKRKGFVHLLAFLLVQVF